MATVSQAFGDMRGDRVWRHAAPLIVRLCLSVWRTGGLLHGLRLLTFTVLASTKEVVSVTHMSQPVRAA